MRRLEKAGLGALYALARLGRDIVWNVRRPTLIGVRGLVVRGGEVLLVRQRGRGDPWTLPGGGVDQHERMEEAARREVYEEAGVAVRLERVLGVYDAFHGEFTNYIVVFVYAAAGAASPPRSLEIADARFFPLDALPDEVDPGSRRRIQEYLAGQIGLSAPW